MENGLINEAKAAYELKEFETAVALFGQLAEDGNLEAQYYLGECYRHGWEVEKDGVRARQLIGGAARSGVLKAKEEYAKMLMLGEGGDIDETEAFKWFLQAADDDSLLAIYWIAVCYRDGKGVERDLTNGERYMRKLAEAGGLQAQFELGEMVLRRDVDEGLYWCQMAADRGYPPAVKWRREQAAALYFSRAKAGDAEAQYQWARISFANAGQGAARKEVIEMLTRAAESGHNLARVYLSVVYANGIGVERSDEQASRWMDEVVSPVDAS